MNYLFVVLSITILTVGLFFALYYIYKFKKYTNNLNLPQETDPIKQYMKNKVEKYSKIGTLGLILAWIIITTLLLLFGL